jgi:hypothetical protein
MGSRGARWGASDGRYKSTSGHRQPPSVQLDSTSGHAWPHPATARECLLSSGSQVRILLRAQVTRLFSLLCSPLGASRGANRLTPAVAKWPSFGPTWMDTNRTERRASRALRQVSRRRRRSHLRGIQVSQTTQIADSERAGRLAVERGVAAQTRQLCVSGSGPDPRLSGSSGRGLVRRKPRGTTRCCKSAGWWPGTGAR